MLSVVLFPFFFVGTKGTQRGGADRHTSLYVTMHKWPFSKENQIRWCSLYAGTSFWLYYLFTKASPHESFQ